MAKKIIVRCISAILTVLTGLLINYLALPAWNIRSGGLWGYSIIMLVFAAIYFGIGEFYLYEYEDSSPICSWIAGGVLATILVAFMICGLTGSKMFNANKYQKLMPIEEGNFAEEIAEATDQNITAVDWQTAKKLGDRTIGTIKNASWYEVDSQYNLIMYNGKAYRISVLNYGGYFKYQKAKNFGIPGYVLVDAVTKEARYVETEKPIMYSETAYFSKDLKRK